MTVETLRPLGWRGRVESFFDHTFHVDPFEWTEARRRELDDAIEEWDNEGGARSPQAGTEPALPERPQGVPEYLNDLGVRRISIGARAFHCIGVSPPDDHPHVYLNVGSAHDILCPYCATRFSYHADLRWDETDPPGCYRGHAQAASHRHAFASPEVN